MLAQAGLQVFEIRDCLSLGREPHLLMRFQEWHPPDLAQVHAYRIIRDFD